MRARNLALLRALARLPQGGGHEAVHAAAASSPCAWLHRGASAVGAHAATTCRLQPIQASRGIVTSAAAAQALAAPQVQGDLKGVLAGLDAAVSADTARPQDVADAALALAALQATGERRLWGKVLERAVALKGGFDAPSLAALLWATTAANVTHYKSLYELAAPAAKLLGTFTPSQLAVVVEGLGRAGVDDADWYKAVADKVASKPGDLSAADAARLLWGFAAAGVGDAKLAKAASAQLVAKAGDAGVRELAQGVWALAALRRSDTATLDALTKALGAKLGGGEAAADVVAALWGFATLGYKPDAQTLARASAAVKGGVSELTTAQAVHAVWALALLGQLDKDTLTAVLKAASDGVAAAPDALPLPLAAALFEAQAIVSDRLGDKAPKVADQVLHYTRGVYALTREAGAARSGAAAAALRADVAAAAVRAAGAKYAPEVAAGVAKLAKTTADGLPVDIGLELDSNTKVAIEVLGAEEVTLAGAPLGSAEARRRLLGARGWAVAFIAPSKWKGASDKDKAAAVLAAIKAQVPAAAGKVSALQKDLEKPFDPYAE